MNKKFALLIAGLMLGFAGVSHAAQRGGSFRDTAWNVYAVQGATTQVFVGDGIVRFISASTGAVTDWFVALDTIALQSNSFDVYGPTTTFMPKVLVSTQSNVTYPPVNTFSGADDYIRIYDGLFVFKSQGPSMPVYVHYRRL